MTMQAPTPVQSIACRMVLRNCCAACKPHVHIPVRLKLKASGLSRVMATDMICPRINTLCGSKHGRKYLAESQVQSLGSIASGDKLFLPACIPQVLAQEKFALGPHGQDQIEMHLMFDVRFQCSCMTGSTHSQHPQLADPACRLDLWPAP